MPFKYTYVYLVVNIGTYINYIRVDLEQIVAISRRYCNILFQVNSTIKYLSSIITRRFINYL